MFLDIKMPNGMTSNTGFNIRPYWKELMDEIKEDWEVVVFTASCKNYADSILDYLDPENKYFPHRFYRETCWLTPEGVYVKDLRVFHQWDLKDIILIDNAVYSFGFQLDNGIPIFPYYKGKDDKQLLYLKDYLKSIVKKDIITELKKTFQMTYLYNSDIDSFLDYYEQESDSDDNNDILDQMVNNDVFRPKGVSFQGHGLLTKNRLSSDLMLMNNNEMLELVPSDSIPRTQSNNVNSAFNEMLDRTLLDEEAVATNTDSQNSEVKPRPKKKKIRVKTMKKVQSVCYPEIQECQTPDKRFSKGFDNSSPLLSEYYNLQNEPRDSTPKRSRGSKKLKKKTRKMKEVKLGLDQHECDVEEEEKDENLHEISLFSQKRELDDVEGSSSSNSQQDGEK